MKDLTGNDLLAICSALGNPHRLRIMAALSAGRQYVSLLARELGISRPLLHMHLQKLEVAGLVKGELELSEEGKAVKYFEPTDFSLLVTPQSIAGASQTLDLETK
ncbi:ArsR/SmtB family transcription factor [Salininema proteolyticum]|uniref:ArsR/SmtB family transcription factor n=1 Tax=Salininema proteolyticum TaxID=1607685 RepID=A0ABV8U3C1_9ACTN